MSHNHTLVWPQCWRQLLWDFMRSSCNTSLISHYARYFYVIWKLSTVGVYLWFFSILYVNTDDTHHMILLSRPSILLFLFVGRGVGNNLKGLACYLLSSLVFARNTFFTFFWSGLSLSSTGSFLFYFNPMITKTSFICLKRTDIKCDWFRLV